MPVYNLEMARKLGATILSLIVGYLIVTGTNAEPALFKPATGMNFGRPGAFEGVDRSLPRRRSS